MIRFTALCFASILIFYSTDVNAEGSCLSFLPYGYNGNFAHLPKDNEFCVQYSPDISVPYKTDEYGGRVIFQGNRKSQTAYFGDSQLLGLDTAAKKHFVKQFAQEGENHVLYAAPNNGPFQAINFYKHISKQSLEIDKVVFGFNFSTDIFRLVSTYDPIKFVPLDSVELDTVVNSPILYDFILFKKYMFGSSLTFDRPSNNHTRRLFTHIPQENLESLLKLYLKLLSDSLTTFNKQKVLLIFAPYWMFKSDSNEVMAIDVNIERKFRETICKTFLPFSEGFTKVLIQDYGILNGQEHAITWDERHFKSSHVTFKKLMDLC